MMVELVCSFDLSLSWQTHQARSDELAVITINPTARTFTPATCVTERNREWNPLLVFGQVSFVSFFFQLP